MRRTFAALIALFVLALAAPAFAQAAAPQVPVGSAFQMKFNHDGVFVASQVGSGYRCYQDGIKVGADLPPTAVVAGVGTCNFPAILTVGNHTLQASAFNATGEVKSMALAFVTVLPAPGAPGGLEIWINGVKVATIDLATVQQMALSVETRRPN